MMEPTDLFFYLFAVLVIGTALIVTFSKNLLHSAFSLFFMFFGVAGFYILLGGDFLAMIQVMVYAGGISILMIFGTMLTIKISHPEESSPIIQRVFSLLGGIALWALLQGIFQKTEWPLLQQTKIEATTATLGLALLKEYVLPFEVVSFLLLTTMVGAILLVIKGGRK